MPQGKVVAIVENGFEDIEVFYPAFRLEEAGYDVEYVTPDGKPRTGEYGYTVSEVKSIRDVTPDEYAALLLPGGVASPDKLRMNDAVVDFVRRFASGTDKPVFAICHGAWTLIDADVVNGLEMTSYWSLRKDLENAGAQWRDEPVVVDGRFVTSRYPKDLPRFGKAIVDRLAERGGESREAEQAATSR